MSRELYVDLSAVIQASCLVLTYIFIIFSLLVSTSHVWSVHGFISVWTIASSGWPLSNLLCISPRSLIPTAPHRFIEPRRFRVFPQDVAFLVAYFWCFQSLCYTLCLLFIPQLLRRPLQKRHHCRTVWHELGKKNAYLFSWGKCFFGNCARKAEWRGRITNVNTSTNKYYTLRLFLDAFPHMVFFLFCFPQLFSSFLKQ